jgi:acyl-CoA thioester hydrolase
MGTQAKKFSTIIIVQPEHLDDVNHVNNVIYVQWMQDVATLHWQAYASEALQQEVAWMVRRHEVDYYNQAFLGDELEVSTWTGEYTNITWKRHYEIIRVSDGKKIISALSTWIPVTRATQKPRRIDEAMIEWYMGR